WGEMSGLDRMGKRGGRRVGALSFRSLKGRKGRVEPIGRERSRVTPRIGQVYSAPPIAPATAWLATTIDTRMPAAPGMGRPTMYFEGLVGLPASPMDRTLKRASRIAPHAVKTKEMMRPVSGSRCSGQW